jgi:hypothetical protein
MKLIIDIPENMYNDANILKVKDLPELKRIIANGTPLLKGEWIFRSGVTCGGYYKCSNCGEVERAEKNYCSNCGAKMKGD